MLFVITVSWKPDKTDEIWKRFAERRVPLTEDVKIVEYYHLIGQNKSVVIAEATNSSSLAQSAINWEDLMEVHFNPAITVAEYLKMRKELLK